MSRGLFAAQTLTAHNATLRHADGLAIDNWLPNRAHDAAPRHPSGLAINNRIGWPSTHGYSDERHQCGQRQSNARQTDDANHDHFSVEARDLLPSSRWHASVLAEGS